jgi:hypothetical protein
MDPIRRRLDAIPPAMEFAMIILAAFGYLVVNNVVETFRGHTAGHISESHLRFVIGYELMVLAVLGLFLHLVAGPCIA